MCSLRCDLARGRFTGEVCFFMATAVCSLRCDLARGRFTGEVCFFYGNGGVQSAGAWRLCLTRLTCLTCLTRWVRHCIPRGFAVPLCGMARVQMCRWGMLACFLATGVCVLRGRGACIRRIRRIRLIFNDEGAPLYTPWVCSAAVWFGSGEDVPLG